MLLLAFLIFVWLIITTAKNNKGTHCRSIGANNNCSGHTMQRRRPLVVDLIIYNGEPMLQFRLEYLRSVVDLFIIVEAKMSFSGMKKVHYDLDTKNCTIIQKLRDEDKLLEVRLEALLLPATFDYQSRRGRNATIDAAWGREKYLRDYALEVVRNVTARRRFVLMVTDLDEMPRQDYVALFPDLYNFIGKGLRLEMTSFIYSFQWQFAIKGNGKWSKPFIMTDESFLKSNWSLSLDELRHQLPAVYLQDAGWHCSFCLPVDLLIRKFQSFSHMELNIPRNTNPAWLSDCILNGWDLLRRDQVTIRKHDCSGSPRLPVCDGEDCPSVAQLPFLHLQTCIYDNEGPKLTVDDLLRRRSQIQ